MRLRRKNTDKRLFGFVYFDVEGFPIPSPFLTCVKAPSENHFAFASSTFEDRSFDGSTNSRPVQIANETVSSPLCNSHKTTRHLPCTGVNESEVASPDVAVPEVLIEAIRPFADFDSFAKDETSCQYPWSRTLAFR